MSEFDRLEEIKKRAKMIEEKAKMNEKLIKYQMKNSDSNSNIEKTMAVNDMYLEAIQAKLKILDKI